MGFCVGASTMSRCEAESFIHLIGQAADCTLRAPSLLCEFPLPGLEHTDQQQKFVQSYPRTVCLAALESVFPGSTPQPQIRNHGLQIPAPNPKHPDLRTGVIALFLTLVDRHMVADLCGCTCA